MAVGNSFRGEALFHLFHFMMKYLYSGLMNKREASH